MDSPNSSASIDGATAQSSTIQARLASGVGEGVLLVTLSCFTYIAAYKYKLGQYLAFGLPVQLVSVDLNDCIRAGIMIISSVFTLLIFLNTPFAVIGLVKLKKNWLRYLVFGLMAMFALLLIFESLFDVSPKTFLYGLVVTFLFLGAVILVASLARKSNRQTSSNEKAEPEVLDLFDITKKKLGIKLYLFLLLFPLMALYAEKLGGGIANKQRVFFRLTGTPLVLVDSTQAGFICKTLDESESKLLGGFTLLSGDEAARISFSPITLSAWRIEGDLKATQAVGNAVTQENKDGKTEATNPDSLSKHPTTEAGELTGQSIKAEQIGPQPPELPRTTTKNGQNEGPDQ